MDVVRVRYDGSANTGTRDLVQGRDFLFDSARFEEHLLAPVEPLCMDLMRIAVGVYAADRKIRRRSGSPWSSSMREMRLDIQVSQPEFWRQSFVVALLQELLWFLSSDLWEVNFSPLNSYRVRGQRFLPLEEDVPVVCLYSGGLDSAAGLASWLRDHTQSILAVSVLHQSLLKGLCGNHIRRLRRHYGRIADLVPVRVHLMRPGRLDAQERSQRCRGLLFLAAGVTAAITKGARQVLMFESGVGAMNVPMMAGMAIGGRTTRNSHPYLMRKMSELASLLAQRRIDVDLPFWQMTKAEVVQALADPTNTCELHALARDTVSCVHYPRHSNFRHCGICPGCIGRRQAMLSAGISEHSAEYECDLLAKEIGSAPPAEKLEYMKAMVAQVHDFGAIDCGRGYSDGLKRWLIDTHIVSSEDEARPWLSVLGRYRAEWLRLAAVHRDCAVPWPAWILPPAFEEQPYAAGS